MGAPAVCGVWRVWIGVWDPLPISTGNAQPEVV